MIRKVIRKLGPLELFEIVTQGRCDHHLPQITKEIVELRGDWALRHWTKDFVLDILKIYLSDSGFQLYTTAQEADSLYTEFASWDIFYNVFKTWYGGDTYIVGFSYDENAFMKLYNAWLRSKKIEELILNEL